MKADWLGARDAALRILAGVDRLDTVEVPLEEAIGRVLAEPVLAGIDVPRWTNSAMDGFAVRAEDVAAASSASPVELPVTDDVPAGGFPAGPLPARSAVRVMTGAPVPEGADSVIRVEHTDGGVGIGTKAARVTIHDAQDATRNLRRKGEDLSAGSVALAAGMILSPGAIGVAASVGASRLRVHRPPVVALLTSGDELVELDRFDEVLAGRKIVSSNSHTLSAQIRSVGCEVRYLGIAADTRESIRDAIAAAEGADCLITSAGISVGEHDHVRRVLEEDFGAEFDFWRVRIRPGSPLAFGRIGLAGGMPWFGLPGNPVSSLVTFEVFVRPALLRMLGHEGVYPVPLSARLAEAVAGQAGLTQFVRVRLEHGSDGWVATTTGPQGSGVLRSTAEADGLAVIPDGTAGAAVGSRVSVIPIDPSPRQLAPVPPL